MLDLPNSANSQKMPQHLKNVQDSNKTQIKAKKKQKTIFKLSKTVKKSQNPRANCQKNTKKSSKTGKNR